MQSCIGAQDMEFDLPGCLGHQPDSAVTSTQVHTLQAGDGYFQVFVIWIQIWYNRLTQHPGDGPAHPVE